MMFNKSYCLARLQRNFHICIFSQWITKDLYHLTGFILYLENIRGVCYILSIQAKVNQQTHSILLLKQGIAQVYVTLDFIRNRVV